MKTIKPSKLLAALREAGEEQGFGLTVDVRRGCVEVRDLRSPIRGTPKLLFFARFEVSTELHTRMVAWLRAAIVAVARAQFTKKGERAALAVLEKQVESADLSELASMAQTIAVVGSEL